MGLWQLRIYADRVLNRILVRHADVGALGEACLFYDNTQFVFQSNLLKALLRRYGADAVVRFVSGGYVDAQFLTSMPAIACSHAGTSAERYSVVAFASTPAGPHYSAEAEVVDIFRTVTERSGFGRRMANKFLDAVPAMELPPDWGTTVMANFENEAFVAQSVESVSSLLWPHLRNPLRVVDLSETGDGYVRFRIAGEDQFGPSAARRQLLGPIPPPTVESLIFTVEGIDTYNRPALMSVLMGALTNLQLASSLQCDISTDPVGSALLRIKCAEIEQAARLRAQSVDDFQETVLDSRDIRTAINSGQRSLNDLMTLLDSRNAKRFKTWASGQPVNRDLAAAYLAEVTAGTWAERLSRKTMRLVATSAIGVGLTYATGPVVGTAAGVAVSAFDSLVLDGLAKGWRPNQFVEKNLKPFVKEERLR